LGQQTFAQGSAPENSDRAIDLHSYELELARYSRLIGESEWQPAAIAQIRASLPPEWTVQQNGAQFQVSTGSLDGALAELQAHPKRVAQIGRDIQFYLDEMRQSAIEMEGAPDRPIDGTARVDLSKIFARREFNSLKGPSEWELLESRISNWIGNLILRLLSRLNLSAQTGNAIAWTIIALAFFAICYWIYRTLSRRPPAEVVASTATTLETNNSRGWVLDALAAADNGDYREAIHCAYWAAIARLEEVRLLKRDRSRTPRESLRLLNAHPDEQTSLQKMTGHFELIWYGYRPASATDWSEAKILLEKFGCLAALTTQTANS
jgi:hypothetical protein